MIKSDCFNSSLFCEVKIQFDSVNMAPNVTSSIPLTDEPVQRFNVSSFAFDDKQLNGVSSGFFVSARFCTSRRFSPQNYL